MSGDLNAFAIRNVQGWTQLDLTKTNTLKTWSKSNRSSALELRSISFPQTNSRSSEATQTHDVAEPRNDDANQLSAAQSRSDIGVVKKTGNNLLGFGIVGKHASQVSVRCGWHSWPRPAWTALIFLKRFTVNRNFYKHLKRHGSNVTAS